MTNRAFPFDQLHIYIVGCSCRHIYGLASDLNSTAERSYQDDYNHNGDDSENSCHDDYCAVLIATNDDHETDGEKVDPVLFVGEEDVGVEKEYSEGNEPVYSVVESYPTD